MTHQLTAINILSSAAALPAELAPEAADSYLTDESRLRGRAERLFFPSSEAEVATVLKAAADSGKPVTISGGRTGITGGAVPEGGWLISLDKMNRLTALRYDPGANRFYLHCQPGVTLEIIHTVVEKKRFPGEETWDATSLSALQQLRASGAWMFPPDPTERSATLGGMASCNASGARTLFYGPTRRYVERVRAALIGGFVLDIARGASAAAPDGAFQLVLPDGTVRAGRIPGYRMPAVKNAAGYFAQPGMDLLDLLIGSEGTLAVVTELVITLIPAPETILGVIGFFTAEPEALNFVRAARGEKPLAETPLLPTPPLALEYFDIHALNLLRDQKAKQGATSAIPALPEKAHTAVYIELATTEADLEPAAEALLALLEACGSSADTAWTAMTSEETERLKAFRHALPETINQRIGERAQKIPGLTKLGTDLAVPDDALLKMMAAYRELLDTAALDYLLFGHIGNNHVHVNILPRNLDEYAQGKALYLELARKALAWGGTVSGEHGIGKLKKPLLRLMYGEAGIAAMRAVKYVFDPAGLLNPGTLFDR
ncbi:MAG: FAD-binding oxidoreductase [Verrucomicrobia bacterium]|nr:FAD-binding oxidoreductase [Verrucomicrobiota bacterium]